MTVKMIMASGDSVVAAAVYAMRNFTHMQAKGPSEGSKRKTKLFPDGFKIQIQRQDGVPAHSGQTCQEDCLL